MLSDSNGIYHIGSKNLTTPYDFALELLKAYTGRDIAIKQSSVVDYLKDSTKPRMPVLGGLKTDKISSLGVNIHTTTESINLIL